MDKREYEAIGLRIRTVQRSLGLADKDVAELLCIEVSSYRDRFMVDARLEKDILCNYVKNGM